jgi:hypothetical protein
MLRLAVIAAAAALILAGTASATVRLVSITPTVKRGSYVTLVVITYETARCTPHVRHGTSRPLVDPALASRVNHLLGALTWRWRMSRRAARGRWSVDVTCIGAGSLHTSFVVV